MSPAFEAATATIVPTVRTAARAAGSVHPAAANTDATPSSVTSVMPEVGCEDTPTIPTMRAATVTKRSPKTATPAAQTARGSGPIPPAKMPGTKAAAAITNRIAPRTKGPGRSRSVAAPVAASDRRLRERPRATPAKAPPIVGRFFTTGSSPATATAPAPMYRTYRDQISEALIVETSFAVSGKSGDGRPAPIQVISGIRTRAETRDPATSRQEWRVPRVKATPRGEG